MRRFLYRLYYLLSSLEYWIRRRFTLGGLLVLSGIVLSASLGLDTNQAVAYQAFTFLTCLLLAALICSRLLPGRFEVRRELPRFATVDTPLIYRVIISNLTGKVQKNYSLLEIMTDPRPSTSEFIETVAAPEGGVVRRNWFDRQMGYFHWRWLVAQKRRARIPEKVLPSLPPKSDLELAVETVPLRRGRLTFNASTLARPDPFGLFRSFTHFKKTESVLVLPKRYPIHNLTLPGNLKYQQGGVALASSVGQSEEFMSLRDYRPGDPIRHIHWRSWAHAGKPVVKEFQDEFFVRHGLVLDTFSRKEPPAFFEEAVSVAASFACSIRSQESLLDLMFVGNEAYCFSSGRGLAHTEQMLEILASVRHCNDQPFSSLSGLVLKHAPLLSGMICILLRWDEERQQFIRSLEALNVPWLALVISEQEQSAEKFGALGQVHFLPIGKIADHLARL